MITKTFYLLIIISLISCISHSKQEKQEVTSNSDSIAYKHIENSKEFIVFSKYILEHPQSKYFQEALEKYHAKRNAYYDSIGDMPVIDCFRNCANIQIRANQEIIYEHVLIRLEDLYDSLGVFLCNVDDKEFYPEKKMIEDINDIARPLSKGHIEVQYVNDSCDVLQEVVTEISRSIDTYKEYLSQGWYNKTIRELDSINLHFIPST